MQLHDTRNSARKYFQIVLYTKVERAIEKLPKPISLKFKSVLEFMLLAWMLKP